MSRPACARCQRPVPLCLCALIPRLHSSTRVLLLQHPSERRHPLNTARLAALGLVNARLEIGEEFPELPLWLEGQEARLLFPGPAAIRLDRRPAITAPDLPQLLVVPDGTWRKARRLLHANPALATLPRVTLPPGPPSRYRVRKAPAADAVSTIEAVVAALNILDAPARFEALLAPFEALIEGQIAAMGAETFARNHGAPERGA
ncbi:tRNA-uridine aminocarboxypropyltransferase [Pseudomonas oryzihabitans]|uniref:tRNA-uridine aminocarboxypropyltransferase n=1 Tax=Pseudomonas oryzihabitans TaxID=47885 RepID=UPI002893B4FE|nr:tRNA-uridine aminocarboxypropyltransferase [Pseudomonas oryzihabitans]MDT3720744.1 tRNA-uridine aminocarboxypropyltransferase [Pseudomonas oryzihabitans]